MIQSLNLAFIEIVFSLFNESLHAFNLFPAFWPRIFLINQSWIENNVRGREKLTALYRAELSNGGHQTVEKVYMGL
jgi:hypothetical protein